MVSIHHQSLYWETNNKSKATILHCKAKLGPGQPGEKGMNFYMKKTLGAKSIIWSINLQSNYHYTTAAPTSKNNTNYNIFSMPLLITHNHSRYIDCLNMLIFSRRSKYLIELESNPTSFI